MYKKKIFAGAAMMAATAFVSAQESPVTLAVRMDDMGALHSVNMAMQDVWTNGISQTIELVPVTAWYPEAVKMLADAPGVDVGVHLAITSEWENVKWRPLTVCPSLTDSMGYFYPMSWPNPAYPGQSLKEIEINVDEAEREFRAQIERVMADVPRVSHISGHMCCTFINPEVTAMVLRLADEYGIPCIDTEDQTPYGFIGVTYTAPDGSYGLHATLDEKIDSFVRMLDTLQPGQRYLFLDHPAYDDAEMSQVYHVGYENVAADRQGVTDMMKDERIKAEIAKRGIELVTIKKLLEK